MSWTKLVVLSFLTTFLILTISGVVHSAALQDDSTADSHRGPAAQRVFIPDSEASNFFKPRSRRSLRYTAELQAEQRVRLAGYERRREYNEEQRTEHENYLEEVDDEQNEKSREINEQLREFHYDGLYPRYFRSH
ncbi:upper zone of growth plate and cartilage matrix associated a [Antennarius striatus]|uniref:upper zone of growth plate and cartilage matrix associated a n=1 Tax=Antennarius striatus TaxID=241820 RepID=UPI0035B2E3AE